jgi:hypothetical protein
MTEQEREEARKYVEGATAAMKRAAKRAREIARQTGTYIVVMRDGKLIYETPGPEPGAEN